MPKTLLMALAALIIGSTEVAAEERLEINNLYPLSQE